MWSYIKDNMIIPQWSLCTFELKFVSFLKKKKKGLICGVLVFPPKLAEMKCLFACLITKSWNKTDCLRWLQIFIVAVNQCFTKTKQLHPQACNKSTMWSHTFPHKDVIFLISKPPLSCVAHLKKVTIKSQHPVAMLKEQAKAICELREFLHFSPNAESKT